MTEVMLVQRLVTLEAGHAADARADMSVFADLEPQRVSGGRCRLVQTKVLWETWCAGGAGCALCPSAEVVIGACWVSPGAVIQAVRSWSLCPLAERDRGTCRPGRAQRSGFHPALCRAACALGFCKRCACVLLGRAPAQRPVPLGRGELRWETSPGSGRRRGGASRGPGTGQGWNCLSFVPPGKRRPKASAAAKGCGCWEHLPALIRGAGPARAAVPRGGPAAGRPGLCVSRFPRPFLHPVSVLPSAPQAACLRQGTVTFSVCVSPLPLGKQPCRLERGFWFMFCY